MRTVVVSSSGVGDIRRTVRAFPDARFLCRVTQRLKIGVEGMTFGWAVSLPIAGEVQVWMTVDTGGKGWMGITPLRPTLSS